MKVLITGAGGFIGRNLAESLCRQYDVLAPARANSISAMKAVATIWTAIASSGGARRDRSRQPQNRRSTRIIPRQLPHVFQSGAQ